MKMKIFSITIIFLIFSASLLAQEKAGFLAVPDGKGDFWFCPSAETALYSSATMSYGAGFAIAYGRKVSIGIKASFFSDIGNELSVLEVNVLARYYLQKGPAISGPFLQIMGGPTFYFINSGTEASDIPMVGRVSAGLSFGWRFLLGKYFFVEPSVKAGYPYIIGISAAAGLHF